MIIHVEFESGGVVVSGGPYRDATVESLDSSDDRAIRKVGDLSSDPENRRSIAKVA